MYLYMCFRIKKFLATFVLLTILGCIPCQQINAGKTWLTKQVAFPLALLAAGGVAWVFWWKNRNKTNNISPEKEEKNSDICSFEKIKEQKISTLQEQLKGLRSENEQKNGKIKVLNLEVDLLKSEKERALNQFDEKYKEALDKLINLINASQAQEGFLKDDQIDGIDDFENFPVLKEALIKWQARLNKDFELQLQRQKLDQEKQFEKNDKLQRLKPENIFEEFQFSGDLLTDVKLLFGHFENRAIEFIDEFVTKYEIKLPSFSEELTDLHKEKAKEDLDEDEDIGEFSRNTLKVIVSWCFDEYKGLNQVSQLRTLGCVGNSKETYFNLGSSVVGKVEQKINDLVSSIDWKVSKSESSTREDEKTLVDGMLDVCMNIYFQYQNLKKTLLKRINLVSSLDLIYKYCLEKVVKECSDGLCNIVENLQESLEKEFQESISDVDQFSTKCQKYFYQALFANIPKFVEYENCEDGNRLTRYKEFLIKNVNGSLKERINGYLYGLRYNEVFAKSEQEIKAKLVQSKNEVIANFERIISNSRGLASLQSWNDFIAQIKNAIDGTRVVKETDDKRKESVLSRFKNIIWG